MDVFLGPRQKNKKGEKKKIFLALKNPSVIITSSENRKPAELTNGETTDKNTKEGKCTLTNDN